MKKIQLKDIILFENDNYIVVNKPPFISTLEDKGNVTTIQLLSQDYLPEAQIAHRIDKETSGALVIAKNPEAYRHLAIQFEKREVNKIYHAVGQGVHQIDGVKIDAPLTISARGNVKVDFRGGKASETLVKTMKAFRHFTLFKCKPLSGRMHQIRVHLAHVGASLVNDTRYGGKDLYLSNIKRNFHLKKGTEELPVIKRFALHANEIEFTDIDGKKISVEAPYPKDFQVLLKLLDKWDV